MQHCTRFIMETRFQRRKASEPGPQDEAGCPLAQGWFCFRWSAARHQFSFDRWFLPLSSLIASPYRSFTAGSSGVLEELRCGAVLLRGRWLVAGCCCRSSLLPFFRRTAALLSSPSFFARRRVRRRRRQRTTADDGSGARRLGSGWSGVGQPPPAARCSALRPPLRALPVWLTAYYCRARTTMPQLYPAVRYDEGSSLGL